MKLVRREGDDAEERITQDPEPGDFANPRPDGGSRVQNPPRGISILVLENIGMQGEFINVFFKIVFYFVKAFCC